jgi:predicted ATPase with chaperone activity
MPLCRSRTARAHDRILKVARSMADLEGCPSIKCPHITEAARLYVESYVG